MFLAVSVCSVSLGVRVPPQVLPIHCQLRLPVGWEVCNIEVKEGGEASKYTLVFHTPTIVYKKIRHGWLVSSCTDVPTENAKSLTHLF